MHPEIRQVGPGTCPICGMALEPAEIAADDAPNPELIDMTRRFWIGGVLTLPILLLAMGPHIIGFPTHAQISLQLSNWLQLLLAAPVVLWAGWPFFERGWRSLVTRNLNMFTLIAIGTGAAFLYSLAATAAPGLFPPAFRASDGSVSATVQVRVGTMPPDVAGPGGDLEIVLSPNVRRGSVAHRVLRGFAGGEELERGWIDPMDIFENHENRLLCRQPLEASQ